MFVSCRVFTQDPVNHSLGVCSDTAESARRNAAHLSQADARRSGSDSGGSLQQPAAAESALQLKPGLGSD